MSSQFVNVINPGALVGQRVFRVAPPQSSAYCVKSLLISERGMNPLSIQGVLPNGTLQELLLTTPGLAALGRIDLPGPDRLKEEANAAVQFLMADPRRQYEMADGLLAPSCNRIWDPRGTDQVEARWLDRPPVKLQANFGSGLAGHGLVYGLVYDEVKPVEANGFYGLRATGVINGWFEKMTITHLVGIRQGEFFRAVSLQNVSDNLRTVIAGIGTHPYFLIGDDVNRAEVTVEIPARFVVMTEDADRPMFPTGYKLVGESALAPLFQKRMAENRLGSISLDHCFFGLTPGIPSSGGSALKVNARIFFPGANPYGLEISGGPYLSGKYNPVNSVVVYSPSDTSGHMQGAGLEGKRNFLCFEMQTPLLGALEFDHWSQLLQSDDMQKGLGFQTATGLREIYCGRELEWEVSYRMFNPK